MCTLFCVSLYTYLARKSKEITEEMLLKRSERNKRRKILADKRKEKTKVWILHTAAVDKFVYKCVCENKRRWLGKWPLESNGLLSTLYIMWSPIVHTYIEIYVQDWYDLIC